MITKKTNQQHPPLPKKRRTDALGNDKRRLWLKDGNSTMLFASGLTENSCKAIIECINSTLNKLSASKKSLPKFLITR